MARPDNSKSDFRRMSAQAASFRKHNLYGARFEFSDLPDADFSAVSAKHCCFIKANLERSSFVGANLDGANFGGANLTGVDFRSAILHHVDFANSSIDGATFVGASMKMCKGLRLSEAQLKEIEEDKTHQNEKSVLARDIRKASPEYASKVIDIIRSKPWVSSADQTEDGTAVVIRLKNGFSFDCNSSSTTKYFEDAEEANRGTSKKNIVGSIQEMK